MSRLEEIMSVYTLICVYCLLTRAP